MKRSQVNAILAEADAFIRSFGFVLPPFAHWSPAKMKARRGELAGIVDARLGWDITDYGTGDFASTGLFLFTVRNGNDYDIKDLELLCAFKSRDGRYTTERRKLLAETVGMKSRQAFPTTLIGHINIRASRAKCALVTASRA